MAESGEILFGHHCVFAAIDSGKREIYEIFILEKSRYLKAFEKKKFKGIKVSRVNKNFLFRLTKNKKHQGIAAKVSSLPLSDISFIDEPDFSKQPFILILDNIEDPMNLGAVSRSALCLGADAIIIPKNRASGITPAVSKVSAGAVEYIPVIEETNIARTIEILKSKGYWIAGLDAKADTSLMDADISAPFALVTGSEGKGIRPLVARKCDLLLKINQKGPVTSLNAGVAASIGIYECIKKIKHGSFQWEKK